MQFRLISLTTSEINEPIWSASLSHFNANDLNEIADTDDIVRATKKVNGGTIGLEDRKHHLEEIKECLGI
jgi:predicted chitinase